MLEELPSELKVAILTHLPGADLARVVARLNHEWRQLARAAVLQRAAERRDEVVAVQRWWRAKREAALAHGVAERMSAIELAIDTAERVIAPKLACLAARRQLLDLLDELQPRDTEEHQRHTQAASEAEAAAGKQRSFIGGMWAAIRGATGSGGAGGKSAAVAPPVVRFSRELVEAMIPERLLLDLVAPFERFIIDARAALLLWKECHNHNTTTADAAQTAETQQQQVQQQQQDGQPSAQTTRQEKEVQMFGLLLIRLLDESMAPIVAYLTYLKTEQINQRIVLPLCQVRECVRVRVCVMRVCEHSSPGGWWARCGESRERTSMRTRRTGRSWPTTSSSPRSMPGLTAYRRAT
jgi:hypothetical protein